MTPKSIDSLETVGVVAHLVRQGNPEAAFRYYLDMDLKQRRRFDRGLAVVQEWVDWKKRGT